MNKVYLVGAGPGGYAAAFLAADLGMKVAILDSAAKPGGVCLQRGCIPSKALLHAAKLTTNAREAGPWGLHFGSPKIDLEALRGQTTKVVETLGKNLAELGKRLGALMV